MILRELTAHQYVIHTHADPLFFFLILASKLVHVRPEREMSDACELDPRIRASNQHVYCVRVANVCLERGI